MNNFFLHFLALALFALPITLLLLFEKKALEAPEALKL
jgi:hypothetical protein